MRSVIFGWVLNFPWILADVFFCVTSPSCQAHWNFPDVENDFLLIRKVVRVARSLRAQCGMTKEKPASESVNGRNNHLECNSSLMNAQIEIRLCFNAEK